LGLLRGIKEKGFCFRGKNRFGVKEEWLVSLLKEKEKREEKFIGHNRQDRDREREREDCRLSSRS